MKFSITETVLSLGVLALGVATAVRAAALSSEGGYAHIGPNFMPAVVAFGLIGCGLWLLYEVFSGGWRERPSDVPEERGDHAFHAPGFLWISAALGAHMALVGSAGFVIAGIVLFSGVAKGFGSTRWVRDVAIGTLISVGVFVFFVRFLNVNLPAGWLTPVLGSAGL